MSGQPPKLIVDVLFDRACEGAQSQYSTTVLPTDSAIVRRLKTSFAQYETRNWHASGQDLVDDFIASRFHRKRPDAYLHARLAQDYGPGRGGLSTFEYADYARALRTAYNLDRDPDTADLVMDMADDMISLYQDLEPLSQRFRKHSNERVDAVIGKVHTNANGHTRFVPGIRSMHPDDLEREAQFRAARRQTRNPYGERPQETTRPRGFFNEPMVKRFLSGLTRILPLKIRNRFEGMLFAAFNTMKKKRYTEAASQGTPTQRFIHHSTKLLENINELERLLIQKHGRPFDEMFNGTETFVGLKNRQNAKDNIFLMYELLRIADPAILQCAKDNFDFRHIGYSEKQFIESYADLNIELTRRLRGAGRDESLLEILQDNGLDDPRIPDDLRRDILGFKKDWVESERQGVFEGIVNLALDLPNSLASCYVFRSAILRHLELPEFGAALRHLIESEIKLMGEDNRDSIEQSLRMMGSFNTDRSSAIFCIINMYYRGFFLNTVLGMMTNPVKFDDSDMALALQRLVRRYPDEMILLDDQVQCALVRISEWLENPSDAYKDFLTPQTLDSVPIAINNATLRLVHGYTDAGKDILLAEGNDNWGMNFVLRSLIEMRKLHHAFMSPPNTDNVSFAMDWQNKSVELLSGIFQRLPYLARQKTGISDNLKNKFSELYPDIDPKQPVVTWDRVIEVIYQQDFLKIREMSRYLEHDLKRADIGPGVANFMFSPAFNPAGGVAAQGGLTFCKTDASGNPVYDQGGNVVFRTIEGYGYRPAAFGHLSDPTTPLTWMQDETGKNVLQYYLCSPQKTQQIFQWLNAKRSMAGQPPLRPTDVMPMFDTTDPRNPGTVAIGRFGGYNSEVPPLFSHGDTALAQEFKPIQTGYFARFNLLGAHSRSLEDPDLYDADLKLASRPRFATFAKTSTGENILEFARVGRYNPERQQFETVRLFDAQISALCVNAFTANGRMVLNNLRNKVIGQDNIASSFVQLLNSYMKHLPGLMREVRADILGDDTVMGSYPAQARPSIRATPSENITDTFSVIDAPAPLLTRGLRYLPYGKGLMRKFGDASYAWIMDRRIAEGDAIIRDTIAKDYAPVARMLGIPEEQAAYSVPPKSAIAGRSSRIDGQPIETLFLSEGEIEQLSGQDALEALEAVLSQARTAG